MTTPPIRRTAEDSEALAHVSENAPETDIPPGRVAPGDMTPTEHAALLRVAAAAEQYRRRADYDGQSELDDALAELRRVRNGGSDG